MTLSFPRCYFWCGQTRRANCSTVRPVLFCDNNSALWGSVCEGVAVESREKAVRRYPNATFVVAIWHPSRTAKMMDRVNQLRSLGALKIIPFAALFNDHGGLLLPHGFWERQEYYAEHDDEIRRVRALLDPEGCEEFDRQMRLRLGDVSDQVINSGVQYFGGNLFQLGRKEVFIDCGAFDGDTIVEFRRATEDYFERIIAFEPDPQNFTALRSVVNGDSRITLQPYAPLAHDPKRFGSLSAALALICPPAGACEVQTITLDEALEGMAPTCMKFDIEGSEPDALEGGRETIARHRPKMAVCLYHLPDHLWSIPLRLNELLPDSRFTLRTYCADGWDCVCYCIPN